MPLFQESIIKKHLAAQDKNLIAEKYTAYKKHFLNPKTQENIRNSKEEQYQGEFLIDLFVHVLGYTKNPNPAFNLTTELKNVKDGRKADGAIIIGEKVVAVIELKGTQTVDLKKVEEQAFSYKNNQVECVYVITSNFEKLRFYIDNAIEFVEFSLFHLSEKDFAMLYLCLAYENIKNNLPKKIKIESINQEDTITKKLYQDYSAFKNDLYQNLLKNNPEHNALILFKKSQKLLDRFLFLFFAEDKLLVQPNSVRMILQDWDRVKKWKKYQPLYELYKEYFEFFNEGNQALDIFPYNGGLFLTDEFLDNLKIDDEILSFHTLKMSDYDFNSEVDVNILGHIFENSLNEIEEITQNLQGSLHPEGLQDPQGVEKKVSKRKKDGVFYTPKYITKYIVENTVGKLCTEKKANFQIIDSEFVEDKKRKKELTLALRERLKSYREWLLQITIIDPACGSGAFLNEALNFLIAEHAYIDELQAKLLGDSIMYSEVEKSILENNLFGVDINEESVDIAKLSLWLRTIRPERKLNNLNNNIKCGNSLISDPEVAGDLAFDWEKEFPQVFGEKVVREDTNKGEVSEENDNIKPRTVSSGFDVVIGNPPYFNIQTLGVGSKQAQWIQKNYPEIWQDKSDILFYFIAKAMQISKGKIGFIVSNAFLFSDKAQKLRNAIVKDNRLTQIVNFEQFMVFEDASITSCITIFSKNKTETKAIVLKNKEYSIDDVSDFINNSENSFAFKLEENKVFALVNDKIAALNAKIDQNDLPLQEICMVGKGMETAANAVFSFEEFPHQFPKEFVKKRMVGEYIGRYLLQPINAFILYFEDVENFEDLPKSIQEHLQANYEVLANRATVKQEGRAWWRYSRPMHRENYHLSKIWCSYRGKNNAFVLDESTDFIGLTNTTVIFDTNKNYSLKYILTLLNSKLLNFRYKSIGKQTGSGVFEYFANGVGKLPIPFCESQQPFISKADLMIELNKTLQEISQKFQRSLERKFDLTDLSQKLQTWYLLSYKDFIKELEKKKIKLSLAQESEWEDYFAQAKAHATEIAAKIAQTDKEIDEMVFALYDLTEEEIAVVRNSVSHI